MPLPAFRAPLLLLLLLLALPQAGCAQNDTPAASGDARPGSLQPEAQPLVPDPGSLPKATSNATFGQRVLARINELRAQQGLQILEWDLHLADLATRHAAYMDKVGKLSHDHFQQRYESADGGLCVENVAWNLKTPEALLENWQDSPEHAKNLLQPGISRAGIGRVGYYIAYFACD